MMFVKPSDDELYTALLARDEQFDGRAWVGVRTTGIFCRLTCPARKPKRENCTFYEDVGSCLDAGYRPCRRCKPLTSSHHLDPVAKSLIDAMEADPARKWSERDVADMGYDPSTVRRIFKRQFGTTFLEMARLRRVRHGAVSLSRGQRVIDAQLDSGFESAAGFRAALARVLGRAPSELGRGGTLQAAWIDTPIGAMIAVTDDEALRILEFFDCKDLPRELNALQKKSGAIDVGRTAITAQIERELDAYFSGTLTTFKTPVKGLGSEFTQGVWRALQNIPLGHTISYGELAKTIGNTKASRAVARANGSNPIAIVVPCHRVIAADGSLSGYAGGRWRKRWLIDHERQITQRDSA
jgi:AraC family transcriptional regulator of adaptative response/methylated-DNA-[protein]-cysteine methyltransferase